MDIANEYGFPTDEATVMERAMITPDRIAALRDAQHGALARLHDLLGVARPGNPPGFDGLPAREAQAAREIGFRPVCWMRWGHLPLPLMRNPQFVGPEGFVKMECYRHRRVYLATTFDDGSALTTSPRGGANARTEYLAATGDFREDYRAHLARVREIVDHRGVRPIYRPTVDALTATYRLFYLYHIPPALGVVMVAQNVGIVAMLILMFITVGGVIW